MNNKVDLTPLDRIRQAETEAAGRVAAANLEAEQLLREAQDRLPDVREQAETAARQRGKSKAEQILAEADRLVDEELNRARLQAEQLTERGQQRMAQAVEAALQLILGAD